MLWVILTCLDGWTAELWPPQGPDSCGTICWRWVSRVLICLLPLGRGGSGEGEGVGHHTSQTGCGFVVWATAFSRFADLQSNDMPCQIGLKSRHVAGVQQANESDALPVAWGTSPTSSGGPAGAPLGRCVCLAICSGEHRVSARIFQLLTR